MTGLGAPQNGWDNPSDSTRRADAVRYAVASTMMEGGVVTEGTHHLLLEWANGTLDDDQLMARVLVDLLPELDD